MYNKYNKSRLSPQSGYGITLYVAFVINVSLCILIMLGQSLNYVSLLVCISMSHCLSRLTMIIIM